MPGFFDHYPRFFGTSQTGASRERLHYRHDLIIEQNKPLLEGRRVVDVASHDGRWSFAALRDANATHAVAIEARPYLVQSAAETFAQYGVAPDTFRLICGDAHAELWKLARSGEKFDTALLLGFLYHTARHYDLICAFAELGCTAVIIDTAVLFKVDEAVVRLHMEADNDESRLVASNGGSDLAGTPSLSAVHLLLSAAGYKPKTLAARHPAHPKECSDYHVGRRFTVVGVRDEGQG